MKKTIILMLAAALTLAACKKAETKEAETTSTEQSATSTEVSNEQETKILKSSKGDVLKVTYFAEGPAVAVRIQKNDEPEQKLIAKTVNAQGNPVFANENWMWEMGEGGFGGRLSDKDGNAMMYKEQEEE